MIKDERFVEEMIRAIGEMDEPLINHEFYIELKLSDSMSGEKSPRKKRIESSVKEVNEVYAHKIHTKISINECHDMAGKRPVRTKWLEVNQCVNKRIEYQGRARGALHGVEVASRLKDLGVTGKRLRVKVNVSVVKSPAERKGLENITYKMPIRRSGSDQCCSDAAVIAAQLMRLPPRGLTGRTGVRVCSRTRMTGAHPVTA